MRRMKVGSCEKTKLPQSTLRSSFRLRLKSKVHWVLTTNFMIMDIIRYTNKNPSFKTGLTPVKRHFIKPETAKSIRARLPDYTVKPSAFYKLTSNVLNEKINYEKNSQPGNYQNKL